MHRGNIIGSPSMLKKHSVKIKKVNRKHNALLVIKESRLVIYLQIWVLTNFTLSSLKGDAVNL